MKFRDLSDYYEKLSSISSRLEMIDLLAEMFSRAGKDEVRGIIYITQGVLAPPFEGIEFGMAEKMVEEAVAFSTGCTKKEVEVEYRKAGDMGKAAGLIKGRSRSRGLSSNELSVNQVHRSMLKIATTAGGGSKDLKIKMLASLLSQSSPLEAKYIVKYTMDELRLGLGDATILEALAAAYCGGRKHKAQLERAYNLCSDLGLVGEVAAAEGLVGISGFKVTLFKPIRPALAERLPTAEQIMERMGGTCAVEQKYDGFRCQIHKDGSKVKIFSRRLEDTTPMFPDLAAAVVNEIGEKSLILDGEALAYNNVTNEFLPFQETIQRKRKHNISEKVEQLPLHLFAFDIMSLGGKDLISEPYSKRRKALEATLAGSATMSPATMILASSPKELEDFFEKSVEEGLEGIVAKQLESEYVAGARKFSWIKMKRSYKGELSDTLDLVVVGYYLGRGMRSDFKFGGLLCATYNEKKDAFETISRIGTGFTEKQMSELQGILGKEVVREKPPRVESIVHPDFWVYPRHVVTVRADEITKSPTHTCGMEEGGGSGRVGLALRFPRLVGDEAIRKDKGPEDATTTKEVIEMYRNQKRVRAEDS
jgi:DNA ligase-1